MTILNDQKVFLFSQQLVMTTSLCNMSVEFELLNFVGLEVHDEHTFMSLHVGRDYKKPIGIMEETAVSIRQLVAVKTCELL